jgi:3-ketosteroid 9alpha-monooxygenase subunit B
MKLAHSLAIAEVVAQGSDAVLLGFEPTADQAGHFSFQPGQYLTLAVDIDGRQHWRCYSITSEPRPGALIHVLVRRVAGGRVSNWICDHARTGLRLQVLPPAGRFLLARPGQPALLFAGGSGIAPIYALARQALAAGAPRVALFYANRNRATAMLVAELDALQRAAGARLALRWWFDDEDGLPSPQRLGDQAQGFEQADVYLCGPDAFMRAVGDGLAQAGFDAARVHREDFGATSDADVDADAAGDTDAADEAGSDGGHAGAQAGGGQRRQTGTAAKLTVQIGTERHTIEVGARQSLLSAMLDAGLPVPHACKVGECASCICRLEEGEIERLDNSVLDDDDVADGWLLACRSRALGAHVRVRFQ